MSISSRANGIQVSNGKDENDNVKVKKSPRIQMDRNSEQETRRRAMRGRLRIGSARELRGNAREVRVEPRLSLNERERLLREELRMMKYQLLHMGSTSALYLGPPTNGAIPKSKVSHAPVLRQQPQKKLHVEDIPRNSRQRSSSQPPPPEAPGRSGEAPARSEVVVLEEKLRDFREQLYALECKNRELAFEREHLASREKELEQEICRQRNLLDQRQREALDGHLKESDLVMKLQAEVRELRITNATLQGTVDSSKSTQEQLLSHIKSVSDQLSQEQQMVLTLRVEAAKVPELERTVGELEGQLQDIKQDNKLLREHNEELIAKSVEENPLNKQLQRLEGSLAAEMTEKCMLQRQLKEETGKVEELHEQIRQLESQVAVLNSQHDHKVGSASRRESSGSLLSFSGDHRVKSGGSSLSKDVGVNVRASDGLLDTSREGSRASVDVTELQHQLISVNAEREKMQSLLVLQNQINKECSSELYLLREKLARMEVQYSDRVDEMKELKMMEKQAWKKLLREIHVSEEEEDSEGRLSTKLVDTGIGILESFRVKLGEGLIEIHIDRVELNQPLENLCYLAVSYCFFQSSVQHSSCVPCVTSAGETCCSINFASYHKVVLSENLVRSLRNGRLYFAMNSGPKVDQLRPKAIGSCGLADFLSFPRHRLHGSSSLMDITDGEREMGKIFYWLTFSPSEVSWLTNGTKNVKAGEERSEKLEESEVILKQKQAEEELRLEKKEEEAAHAAEVEKQEVERGKQEATEKEKAKAIIAKPVKRPRTKLPDIPSSQNVTSSESTESTKQKSEEEAVAEGIPVQKNGVVPEESRTDPKPVSDDPTPVESGDPVVPKKDIAAASVPNGDSRSPTPSGSVSSHRSSLLGRLPRLVPLQLRKSTGGGS